MMEDFLEKFYPCVDTNEQDNYCKYNNNVFQFFISAPYVGAIFAAIAAGSTTQKWGHRNTMLLVGIFSMIGSSVSAGAQNLVLLLLGRVLLGVGMGFANQAIPLYLSEIAPPDYRGRLSTLFSCCISVGAFVGSLLLHKSQWTWRFVLAVEIVPGISMILARFILVDTPSYLICKDKHDEAKNVLKKIRGHDNIEQELGDLVQAREAGRQLQASFRKRNLPQLIMASVLQIFQQFSGNDVIMSNAPFLFKVMGLRKASLVLVIMAIVAVVGTISSMSIVDKAGRRTILGVSAIILFFCMLIIGILNMAGIRSGGIIEAVIVCLFVGVYKASMGPLTWLIPSEIFPQDVRSAGQSITVFTNMVSKFVLVQTFQSLLCILNSRIYFLFACALFCMCIYSRFLPETKGIPIDQIHQRWHNLCCWGRIVGHNDDNTATMPATPLHTLNFP